MKNLNVLSLFDGMSCGQLALNRAGIEYNNYFASEIDAPAISVTQSNYPDTIQLGDVVKLNLKTLPKIDLLIGGSPCQGFSFSGKRLNFNDSRSVLFFEFVRVLKELSPRHFLLENVKMKKEHQDIITRYLGVQPLKINSGTLSAQNRERLYWTNIDVGALPKDKGLILSDVLTSNTVNLFLRKKYKDLIIKTKNIHKSKNGLIFYGGINSSKRWGNAKDTKSASFSQGHRIYCASGKAPTLSASMGGCAGVGNILVIENLNIDTIRKLSPEECEKLQTVPFGYTDCVAKTNRHKMLGNGWTVDVVAHILGFIK